MAKSANKKLLGTKRFHPTANPKSNEMMDMRRLDNEYVAADNPDLVLSPAQEWAMSRSGDGTEEPDKLPSEPHQSAVERTFCFVDLSGFTNYTRKNGPTEALRLLDKFRALTRKVASARGVRVAKWLGDGALLVSTEPGPCIATAAHLAYRFQEANIAMRVGIAAGTSLLLDGDDYVGEPVNLAAKLCAAAHPGEILASVQEEDLPSWVNLEKMVSVEIKGVGLVGGMFLLKPRID